MYKFDLKFTVLFASFLMPSDSVKSNYFNMAKGCLFNGKLPSDDHIEDHLFEALTDPKCYKNWIRPNLGQGPVQINASAILYSLATISDVHSEFSIQLMLDLEWIDERLRFDNHVTDPNTTLEGDIHHLERIWTPILRVPNTKEPWRLDSEKGSRTVLVRIQPDGWVLVRRRYGFFRVFYKCMPLYFSETNVLV